MGVAMIKRQITWEIAQTEITHMIRQRLALASHVLEVPEFEHYPGQSTVVHHRLLAEAIGWASR